MILRLSGADFSANNIGSVQLVRELTTETKTLLANYTRELTSNQKLAVQDFIQGLKDNNIWSKIGNLYIPLLAGNVSETLFNVKTSTLDCTMDGTYYELVDGSVKVKDEYNTVVIPSSAGAVKVNGSYMNLHLMSYVKDGIYKTDERHINTIYGGVNAYKSLKVWGNDVFYGGNPPFVAANNLLTPESVGGFLAVNSGTDKIYGVYNNRYGTQNAVDTVDTTITNVNMTIACASNRSGVANISQYMIGVGTSMSKEEMLKYNELCDALVNALIN